MKDLIHKKIQKNKVKIDLWWEAKCKNLDFPIYTSVDIRDGGEKLASVDANIFPAGFNNICDVDIEADQGLIKKYLLSHYKRTDLKILLLSEEHTSNKYYWENVYTLNELLRSAGCETRVAVPKEFDGIFPVTTPKGANIEVYSAHRDGHGVKTSDGFVPDLVVSNNDFSDPYDSWYNGLQVPMNPSHELGWFRRKKSDHFTFYNKIAEEFSHLIDVDPWTFTVKTELAQVDFSDDASVEVLARKTQMFIDGLKSRSKDPVVFIKNNRGTYGMGILSVRSGEELLSMTGKERKKMGYSKGGSQVQEVILQEGIPTEISSEGSTAEPVIYLIGCELAGGFMRTHKDKGPTENLNSPGAVFKRLCMSDLLVNGETTPLENVYGMVARMNVLAIGLEAQAVGVKHSSL